MLVLCLMYLKMDTLPGCLIHLIYKYKHEMLYSKVMKQLKTYRLNLVLIVSLEFLEYGYCEFGGGCTRSIDINNIDATSHEILGLLNNDYNSKWVGGFGVAF